jgi:hypothetical protein
MGRLKPPCEKRDYDDNQDDAERADAAMAVAIAVAAEATTEPTDMARQFGCPTGQLCCRAVHRAVR